MLVYVSGFIVTMIICATIIYMFGWFAYENDRKLTITLLSLMSGLLWPISVPLAILGGLMYTALTYIEKRW